MPVHRPLGSRLGFVIQTEIGYALAWRAPGFCMAFGVGLRAAIPFFHEPAASSFNTLGEMLSFYMPLFNPTVGS